MSSSLKKGCASELPSGAAAMATPGKPSLNKFALLRLMTVERAMRQTQTVVEKTKAEIEIRMKSGRVDSLEIEKQLESKRFKNDMLKEYKETLKNAISECQEMTVKVEKDCVEKSDRLGSLRDELEKKKKNLEMQRRNYQERRETYLKINALLLVRRKQLINEISNIYPVEERVEAKTDRRSHSIFGFVVPNADDISSIKSSDEEKVASGLGYTAHILLMISQFLDMPLRFPIIHCGSRSRIHDHITKELLDRDRDFPLHSKGKEKFLFNYGVFLLNKNIAQLRHYCGLSTQDLRNTLPNLHSLLEQRLGVQIGNKVPVRSGAGLHSLPSSSKQIVQANDLVGVFKVQTSFSKESGDCAKPVDDSRLHPAIPSNADSPSDVAPMQAIPASNEVEDQNGGTEPESEEEREKDANGEREKWLERNPTMAAFIGHSNPRQVDSEGSFDNSGDEDDQQQQQQQQQHLDSRHNEDGRSNKTRDHESNGHGIDDEDDVTPTAEMPSDIGLEIASSPSNSDGKNHSDKSASSTTTSTKTPKTPLETHTSDSSVPQDDVENVSNEEQKTDTTSDIPKGLQTSTGQSKLKAANQRPAGLSAAAHKGVPKGLSRGNARGASFHGGAGGRTQQSASRLIAETFAKHKSDPNQSNKDQPSPVQTLTNANFNLVDRSKRVISDE